MCVLQRRTKLSSAFPCYLVPLYYSSIYTGELS